MCGLQELLLRVGALGHIVPLLFGYDATHDAGSHPDHFDYTGTHKAQGPAFLGLGIQRSNMQVQSPENVQDRLQTLGCTYLDCNFMRCGRRVPGSNPRHLLHCIVGVHSKTNKHHMLLFTKNIRQ